jgi:hypothetical protein
LLGFIVPSIAQPSVQSLLLQMRFDGQLLATGTGFAVRKGVDTFLITNRHNATGRHQGTNEPLSNSGGVPNEVAIFHNRTNRLGEWVLRIERLYDGDTPLWIEHPVLRDRVDVVALRLTDTEDVALYPYDPSQPGADIFVGPADVISVIGFPFGLTAGGAAGLWATGFLASEPDIDFNGLPVFLIDCRSRQGQSSSPVIAYRSGGMVATTGGGAAAYAGPVWRFLGVYSGRINAESDIGMVWKASCVAELIAAI